MNNYNHQAADLQGMKEAEARYGSALSPVDIEQQYRQIQRRPVGNVQPYTHFEEVKKPDTDTGALKPSQMRGLKMVSILSVVWTGCAAFLQQAATGAFNTYFGWAIGAGAGCWILSGLFSGVSGGSGGGIKKEYHEHHHHYHQNNNFGGSGGANQNNGKAQ